MNNQITQYEPTAEEAYKARAIEIAHKYAALAFKLSSHTKPGQPINWGHVGDLGRIIELLDEALGHFRQ